MNEIVLKGLDGSNLLAFLAALGAFRVLTRAEPDQRVQMSWRDLDWWTPVIHHSRIASEEALVETVTQTLSLNPACRIGPDLVFSREEFADVLKDALNRDDRNELAFLAALGSEFIGSGPKKAQMTDTEFRTMSGAGHQHFLGFMQELAESTEPSHIEKALFASWDYSDDRPSLRWDPVDYRPHALRADDPSKAPIRTVRGANRLAIEALPLFPTFPRGRSLETVAFVEFDGESTVQWPIWTEPLKLPTVESLLGFDWSVPTLSTAFGVAQRFRSARFTEGKYRNFAPSRAIL